MNMLFDLDYTFKIVVLGCSLLGFISGAMGVFAVLRKQSLLGDAISHAALPGIALVFLFTASKHPLVLISGAILAGILGTILYALVKYNSSLKSDAILGIVLSVFFGFGLFLMTLIQRLPLPNKAGLKTYLFGNAATILSQDLWIVLGFGSCLFFVLLLFWKEFKVLMFDSHFAETMGYPVKRLEIMLTILIVIAIVIGLQMVGVVLMSAMIIAPASAARQWTDRLSVMVLLSGGIGALSGSIGTILSTIFFRLPTGPSIVLVVSFFVLLSLLFAPNRGLLFAFYRQYRNRYTIAGETLLNHMFLFSKNHQDPYYPHDRQALEVLSSVKIDRALNQLRVKVNLKRKLYIEVFLKDISPEHLQLLMM